MKKILLLGVLSFFTAHLSLAQNKAKVNVKLRNGDIITGEYKLSKVTLTTDYGKLTIPPESVNQIKFGLKVDKAKAAQIKKLIEQFNVGDETAKSDVYVKLLEYETDAIPVLEDYIASDAYMNTLEAEEVEEVDDTTSEEPIITLEQVLSDLYSQLDEASLSKIDEVLLNDGYQIGGQIAWNDVSVQTEFGSLKIPRNKIADLTVIEIEGDSQGRDERTFRLIDSKHISGNKTGGWLKTGIRVSTNETINIVASGAVNLASLSNKTYYPSGKNSNTSYQYAGSKAGGSLAKPTYGQVVFKVGINGQVQVAGSVYKGRANGTGELYLSIYETVYNKDNTGIYTVRIRK
ncbi:MAG: hypothetical protein AAF734_09405 [Bacteroidota bacterium]